jgi:hypothetical protein
MMRDLRPFENRSERLGLPTKSFACLRLSPVHAIPPFRSEQAALQKAAPGGLKPFGVDLPGYTPDRNPLGAVVYTAPAGEFVYNFSQLFLSGEIIGIDLKSTRGGLTKGQIDRSGVIDINEVERAYLSALINYAAFFKTISQVPLPWRLDCGLYRVRNFALFAGARTFGNILRDSIPWSTEIGQFASPIEILRPFFETMWEAAGSPRDNTRDANLARLFGL